MGRVRSCVWGIAIVVVEWTVGGVAAWACIEWWRAGTFSGEKLAALAVSAFLVAGVRAGLVIALANSCARRRGQGS